MKKAFEKILERLEREIVGKPTPDEYNNGINRAYSIVKEMTEEYKSGWIPCSERLPDADENVLTCSEYGFITVSSCNNAGEFRSYADEYCIKYPKPKVIAWQPLPEPFKESD